MIYLLNPRVWIAAVVLAILSFTHFTAYRAGKGAVKREWERAVAEQREEVIKAQEQARKAEQALVVAKNEAEKRYVEQKRKAAADAAGSELLLRRLRDELAARDSAAAQAAAATPGIDGGAGLERNLFGACAQALVRMAQEADRLEATVVGLQGYVKNVCQASSKD